MYKKHLLFIFIVLLSSCTHKQAPRLSLHQNKNVNVYFDMPKNVLVFQNVSPLIYKELNRHFLRVGYHVTTKKNNAYRFLTKIKKLEPNIKFISPDIILYATKILIELECMLYDKNNKKIASKTFTFHCLSSKPNNPIENPAFLNFEYKKMLNKNIGKIEKYFRKYLIIN